MRTMRSFSGRNGHAAPVGGVAFDWLPHPAIAYDSASGQLDLNRRARDAFGELPDGVTLDSFAGHFRLRSEQGRPLLTDDLPLQRALGGEQVRDQRIQIGGTNGAAPRIVSVCADPVRGPDGRVLGAVTVMLTLVQAVGGSDRERRLSRAAVSMAEAMALVRSSDGTIDYTNPAWDSLFGYDQGELVGQHMSVVEAPPDEHSPGKRLREIVARLDHGEVWRGELEHVSKGGRHFRWQTSIARLDDEDQPLWVIVPTNGHAAR
jgi:PAS domain S-box-containing protein